MQPAERGCAEGQPQQWCLSRIVSDVCKSCLSRLAFTAAFLRCTAKVLPQNFNECPLRNRETVLTYF
jgi:hypothetical protein